MASISEKFYEARNVPKNLPRNSTALRDWYDEHLYYCWEGRTINGHRMTGDHYWFLNFTPIELFYTSPITQRQVQDWDYGRFSQADDYVMKQFEEAEKENMGSILFTGRGYGKTYLVISIGIKTYYLEVGSHNLITAAIDDHAKPTFDKVKKVMNELEERHPSLRLKRINDNDGIIQAGEVKLIDGEKKNLYTSQFEKIVYGNSAGKSKGRRVRFQHWEEMGDWSCSAPLKECIASSEGTWLLSNARVFYTGTGGTIKSDQARELFFNPRTYNIYPVKPYEERRISILIPDYAIAEGQEQGIFLPSIIKRKDFYEFDRFDEQGNLLFDAGEDDLEGALADVMADRDRKSDDPQLLNKNVQEYPITAEEVFRDGGAGVFDRAALGKHKLRLQNKQISLPLFPNETEPRFEPERGRLEWVYEKGKKVGVRWEVDPEGKILIAEHPPMDEKGRLLPIANAYIGGLDSLDQGKDDSMTDMGSELALAIKKRQAGVQQVSNFYCCFYKERPNNPDDAFDNVLKVLWYYSCQVNLEYTKISIRPYFMQRGEFWRFVRRPKMALGSVDEEKISNLIGTQLDGQNQILGHGLRRLKMHLRENMGKLYFVDAASQLINYTMANKTKQDMVAAMVMAELADEDLADVPPVRIQEEEVMEMGCYYEDEFGYMQFGVPPKGYSAEVLNGVGQQDKAEFYDEKGRALRLNSLSYVADMDDVVLERAGYSPA